MDRTEKRRGARPLEIRDWPFGSRGRRLLLAAVLLGDAPSGGWRKVELERAVAVERGGADRLLAGASSLGLLRWDGRRWHRGEPPPPLGAPLRELVALSRELPAGPPPPLSRRPYRRG